MGNFVTSPTYDRPAPEAVGRFAAGACLSRAAALRRLARLTETGPEGRFLVADSRVPAEAGALLPQRARLFLILQGTRRVRLGRNGAPAQEDLRPGDMLYCNPRTWHRPLRGRPHRLFSVIFDPSHTALTWKRCDGRRDDKPSTWLFGPLHSPALRNTIQALDQLTPAQEAAGHGLARGLLHLLHHDLDTAPDYPRRARVLFHALLEYVEEHYHSAIDRSSVARAFGIHPNHLSRLFRQEGGESFMACLTRLRLARARSLLTEQFLPVKEVAARCGFASPNYFCKVFRKAEGLSPAAYAAASV